MQNQLTLQINQALTQGNFVLFFNLLKNTDRFDKSTYLNAAIATAKAVKNFVALRQCAMQLDTYSSHELEEILTFLVQMATPDNLALDVAFRIAAEKKVWFLFAKSLLAKDLKEECIGIYDYLNENYEKYAIASDLLQRCDVSNNIKRYFYWLNRVIESQGKYGYLDQTESVVKCFKDSPDCRQAIIPELKQLSVIEVQHKLLTQFSLICIECDDDATWCILQKLLPENLSWLKLVQNAVQTGKNLDCLGELDCYQRPPLLKKFCSLHQTDLIAKVIEAKECKIFLELLSTAFDHCLSIRAIDNALMLINLAPSRSRRRYLESLPIPHLSKDHWPTILKLCSEEDLLKSERFPLLKSAAPDLLDVARRLAKDAYVERVLKQFANCSNVHRKHASFNDLDKCCDLLIDTAAWSAAVTCVLKLVKSSYRDNLLLRLLIIQVKRSISDDEIRTTDIMSALLDKTTAKQLLQIRQHYQAKNWHKCLNLLAQCNVDLRDYTSEILGILLLSDDNLNLAMNIVVSSNILNRYTEAAFIENIVDKVFTATMKSKQRLKHLNQLVTVKHNGLVTRLLERLLTEEQYELVIQLYQQITEKNVDIREWWREQDGHYVFSHNDHSFENIETSVLKLIQFFVKKCDVPNSFLKAMDQANLTELADCCRDSWLRARRDKLSAAHLVVTQVWPKTYQGHFYLAEHVEQALSENNQEWCNTAISQMKDESCKLYWQKIIEVWFKPIPLEERVDAIIVLCAQDDQYHSFLFWLSQNGFKVNALARYLKHFIYFSDLSQKLYQENASTIWNTGYDKTHEKANTYFRLWYNAAKLSQKSIDLIESLHAYNPSRTERYTVIALTWANAMTESCWSLLEAGNQPHFLINLFKFIDALKLLKTAPSYHFKQSEIEWTLIRLIDKCLEKNHYSITRQLIEKAATLIPDYPLTNYYHKLLEYYFTQNDWQQVKSILQQFSLPNRPYQKILAYCQGLIRRGELNTVRECRDLFLVDAHESSHVELVKTYIENNALTSARFWCQKQVKSPHVIIELQNTIYDKYREILTSVLGTDGPRRVQTIHDLQGKIVRLLQLNPANLVQTKEYNKLKDECIQTSRTLFEKGIAAFATMHFGDHNVLPIRGGNIYFALMEYRPFQSRFPECLRYCRLLENSSTTSQFHQWLRIHLSLSNADKHDPAYLPTTPQFHQQNIDMRLFLPELLDLLTKMLIKLFQPQLSDQKIDSLTPSLFQEIRIQQALTQSVVASHSA